MRRLVLHIGYPKTGTTTLQRFLAANRAALLTRGVLYPTTGALHDAHYGVTWGLDIALYSRPEDYPKPDGVVAALAAEASAAGAEQVILSSEYLITANQQERRRLRQAFADWDVRVLCYLRRHDDAFEASYAQSLKSVTEPPWGENIHAYILHQMGLGQYSFDYLGLLRQWAGVFGKDAIIVRPYEAAQNLPDLPGDFLAALGIADGPDLVRPPSSNRSIGPRVAAAIAMVRRTGLEDARKRQVVGRLIMLGERGREPYRYLDPLAREAIVRRYEWTYGQIAGEFLGDPTRPLFTAPMPHRDDPPAAPAFTAEELLETVLQALAG